MNKKKLYDYFILCVRVLLAWTFIRYGWGKLADGQFGLSSEEVVKPLNKLSLFKLSWYLFDLEPFKSFIGVSQIIAGLLLLYSRTLIIGALMSIPILANILIIDITYIKMTGFYWRLSYYLILDFLILWYYRERMFAAFKIIFNGLSTKFKYPIWAYLILPVMAFFLDFFLVIPRILIGLVINPSGTWNDLGKMGEWLIEIFKKIGT